jgi:integrase
MLCQLVATRWQSGRPVMSDHTQRAELEKAVHLVLSRMIGTQTGWRAHTDRLPLILGATAGCSATGKGAKATMRQLGLGPIDLDDRWAVARANGQLLKMELVEAFFPREHWPFYARFIELGPMRGWQEVESILICWARGLEPDGSHRAQPLSANSISCFIVGVHRLMRELCELRKLAASGQVALDASVLEGWESQQLPRPVTPHSLGAQHANSDRRAPSLRAVRLALRDLDRKVKEMQKTAYGRRSMSQQLRNRALLGVFLTLGGRRGAIMALRRKDFVRFHRSEGSEGPAILLRPGKTLHHDHVRAKFLPAELGEWIHEWIEYAGTHDEPDAPLWVRTAGSRESLKENTVGVLIPRLLADYMPDRRCSPHTLRHLCEKLAFHAGMDWLEENRDLLLSNEGLSGMPTSPQQLADALLDHAFGKVQDVYKDMNSERAREIWARIAAEGVWSLIWGDKGAPKGPDPELVHEAQNKLNETDVACRRASEELQRLEAKKKVARQQAIDTAGSGDVGLTLKAMLELDVLGDDVAEAISTRAELEKGLEWAQHGLKEARATRIPLPDEEPVPAEIVSEVELPAIAGETASLPDESYRRDRITVREFHWALSGGSFISEPTLRRWVAGQLPYRLGDRRNVWDPPRKPGDLPDCIYRPSPRKTWILLDRLDWTRFPLPVIERLKYLQTLGEEEVFVEDAAA